MRLALRSVPRPPKKPSPDAKLARVTFMLDSDVLGQIDHEVERMSKTDETGRAFTRTDVLRVLIRDGLKYRAEKRGK